MKDPRPDHDPHRLTDLLRGVVPDGPEPGGFALLRLTAAGRKQLRAETSKWNRMAELIAGILNTTPEEL